VNKNLLTRVIIIGVVIMMAVILSTSSGFSQVMKVMKMDAGDASEMFNLSEVGAIIIGTNDTIKVDMAMPGSSRPPEYKDVDIQTGDVIKMVNGKSLTSVAALKDIYEGLEIGEEVKMGIMRESRMHLVKFAKGDPKKLPQMAVAAMPAGGGMDESATVLIDAGILLTEKDGKLSIMQLVDQILAKFDGGAPREGDIIIELQGKEIKAPSELAEIYSKVKPGDKVSLVLKRDRKIIPLSYTRKDMGNMKIKTRGN